MPRTLGSHLNLFFTKLKHPIFPPGTSSTLLSSDDNHHHNNHSILIKNYNSLYEFRELDSTPMSLKSLFLLDSNHIPSSSSPSSSSSSFEPDLTNILPSHRFFFSSPGNSNSIIESTSSLKNKKTNNNIDPPRVKDSVAVPTYSPDPYKDFRRSMQEMVEARDLVDVQANWDSLHELLLCYLALNPKSTHKFIVGAFADLLVSLLSFNTTAKDNRDVGFEGSG